MTCVFDHVVILQGEIRYWSLLGLEGLRWQNHLLLTPPVIRSSPSLPLAQRVWPDTVILCQISHWTISLDFFLIGQKTNLTGNQQTCCSMHVHFCQVCDFLQILICSYHKRMSLLTDWLTDSLFISICGNWNVSDLFFLSLLQKEMWTQVINLLSPPPFKDDMCLFQPWEFWPTCFRTLASYMYLKVQE